MRIRSLHKLLLATVLVFGQCLSIAHDYQHPATGGDTLCQVCVHGQNFQAGPCVPAALNSHGLTREAPSSAQSTPALTRRHTHAAIRAPPSPLV